MGNSYCPKICTKIKSVSVVFVAGVFILTLPIPIVVNSFASYYKNRLWRNEVAMKKRERIRDQALTKGTADLDSVISASMGSREQLPRRRRKLPNSNSSSCDQQHQDQLLGIPLEILGGSGSSMPAGNSSFGAADGGAGNNGNCLA